MMAIVGVIGAGQMGAGIAQVAAQAGYGVVLSDINLAAAEKGKAGIGKILARAVAKEKITQPRAPSTSSIKRQPPISRSTLTGRCWRL